jgi:hypothetical protein
LAAHLVFPIVDVDRRKAPRTPSSGFGFAFAARLFDEVYIERYDSRIDYGEQRVVAIGEVDRAHIVVVYTDRTRSDGSSVRRIISARASKRKERRQYAEAKEAVEKSL